jgi:DNA topoisomerase-2
MYIGDIENTVQTCYVRDPATDMIVSKEIKMCPGLLKIFDEVLINARDQVVRLQTRETPSKFPVKCISVSVTNDGIIEILNDGEGLPVVRNLDHDLWVPEMVFGHLRSSSNYGSEKKIVGGLNGFGSKLAFIWSTESSVETVDNERGLKFKQSYGKNLESRGKPSVTKSKVKPYTRITFTPDYTRFGIDMSGGLPEGIKSVLERRVYDLAAVTSKDVKVKYNGTALPVKTFEQYVDQYIGSKTSAPRVYESSDRWDVAACLSPTEEFSHVSFVNGIFTKSGGTHVSYITNQIARKLIAYIEAKKKIKVKSSTIREQLMVFIRSDIVNPNFTSQTKDELTTPSSKFGSSFNLSDKFIEKLAKMGIMDTALSLTLVKSNLDVAKKTDGIKKNKISGIPTLCDANFAGTDRSGECILILTEGLSAMAGVMSGLSREDRSRYGVYPLKGKVLNTRDLTTARVGSNKEITDLKRILGLESGKKYTPENVKTSLRYGKGIMIMTDADLDGSHIKGLLLNLFEDQWNSLSQVDGYISYMYTPILKATRGNVVKEFYDEADFREWVENVGEKEVANYKIKYYKGLGTSSAAEFKQYFENMKTVTFEHSGEDSANAISMAFSKDRADDRKEWLQTYDRALGMDLSKPTVSFSEFVDRELIHFSKYDCDRSIPNTMDGLKTSQRKILYTAFKKNIKDIKVAAFSGTTSLVAKYHHGEASLEGAIVGMAQNFVGSNNIPLLEPIGQFGTRLASNDSASPRYIFTSLSKITRLLFPAADDKIASPPQFDDGDEIEPVFFCPTISVLACNGSSGIGTGFSCTILPHDPRQIVSYVIAKLNRTTPCKIEPFYNGFTGTCVDLSAPGKQSKYLFKGTYALTGNSDEIIVTELPPGYWTNDFREYLDSLCDSNGKKLVGGKPPLREFSDMSTDTRVEFTCKFQKGLLSKLMADTKDMSENPDEIHTVDGVEKLLKLTTVKHTSNMNAFNSEEKLTHYETIYDLVDDHFAKRLELYGIRKQKLIETLSHQLSVLSNKVKYIESTLNDTISLQKKSKDEIRQMLDDQGFDVFDDDEERKYLVKMSMDSVSTERVSQLVAEKEKKAAELEDVKSTSASDMWLKELHELQIALSDVVSDVKASEPTKVAPKKKKVIIRKKKKKE